MEKKLSKNLDSNFASQCSFTSNVNKANSVNGTHVKVKIRDPQCLTLRGEDQEHVILELQVKVETDHYKIQPLSYFSKTISR